MEESDRVQPNKKIPLFCVDCGKAIFPRQKNLNPNGSRCRVCNNKFRNSNPEFKEAQSNRAAAEQILTQYNRTEAAGNTPLFGKISPA